MANTTAISHGGGVQEIVCGSGVNHVAIACFESGSDMEGAGLNQALSYSTGVKVKFSWAGFYYRIYRWVDGTDTLVNNDIEIENTNPGHASAKEIFVPMGCYLKLVLANKSRLIKVVPYV